MAGIAGKYVVIGDAVVVTTGTKKNGKPETVRVMHGGVLTVKSTENEHVESLLSQGVIVKATSAEHMAELRTKRLTVREVALLSGAADDPVQPPLADVQPLEAPLPDIGVPTGSLTQADADAAVTQPAPAPAE